MENDLLSIFNKYAGREVAVAEKTVHLEKLNYTFTEAHLDYNDPAIKELEADANKAGLDLRVWTPGSVGTMDVQDNRLNARVDKESDGKYRIQKDFYLG